MPGGLARPEPGLVRPVLGAPGGRIGTVPPGGLTGGLMGGAGRQEDREGFGTGQEALGGGSETENSLLPDMFGIEIVEGRWAADDRRARPAFFGGFAAREEGVKARKMSGRPGGRFNTGQSAPTNYVAGLGRG